MYKVTEVGTPDAGWGDPISEGSTWVTKPDCLPATMEKLDTRHAYLIDNGEYLFLYLCSQVKDDFIQNVREKR